MCYGVYTDKKTKIDQKDNSENIDMILEMELIAYSHAKQNFAHLTAEEANAKVEAEIPFFLYIGRPTCQWCRRMVPILNKVIKENDIELFYLDSENTERDETLSNFRNRFEIETVPSIIYFKGAESYYTFVLNVTANDIDKIEKNLREQFKIAINEIKK